MVIVYSKARYAFKRDRSAVGPPKLTLNFILNLLSALGEWQITSETDHQSSAQRQPRQRLRTFIKVKDSEQKVPLARFQTRVN